MKIRSKQKGFALLLFITALTAGTAALTVRVLNNSGTNTQIARDKITAAALAQAKDALIGYAITYGDTHPGNVFGYLPCPDTSGTDIGGEGAAAGVCGAQDLSAIGKLPWKTLKLPPLRGGDNECLWYAVSGTYKNNPPTGLMNWDSNGQLQVYASDGTTLLTPASNQAVAVIFAPGLAAPGQNRAGTTAPVCGGNYTATNYLDTVGTINNASVSNTAGANSQFRMGDPTLHNSDYLVFITKQDIWNALKKREPALLAQLDTMTQQTAECIANFGTKNKINGTPDLSNKSLPWPARLTLTDYGDNASYNDRKNLNAGRVPYQVDTTRAKTGNSISSDFLLTSGTCDSHGINCTNNCPNPDNWAAIYPWWYNWKEHLFYAISQNFQPASNSTTACGNCLSVNNSLIKYAGVVMFAGKKLSALNQTRADKSAITDYLEGRNATNVIGPANGNENYQAADTTIPPSTNFNDIVYCIKEDLSVVKGTTAGCP